VYLAWDSLYEIVLFSLRTGKYVSAHLGTSRRRDKKEGLKTAPMDCAAQSVPSRPKDS